MILELSANSINKHNIIIDKRIASLSCNRNNYSLELCKYFVPIYRRTFTFRCIKSSVNSKNAYSNQLCVFYFHIIYYRLCAIKCTLPFYNTFAGRNRLFIYIFVTDFSYRLPSLVNAFFEPVFIKV